MQNRSAYRGLRAALLTCGAVLGLALCQGAGAHGGLSIDDDMCKLRLGPFNMHFTGYQPAINGNREFCEDIPKVGHTIVVMDAMDPELREMPIEVRIIRDTGDERQLDAITVAHLPPKIYESGSVPLEYSFTTPGRFVGLGSTPRAFRSVWAFHQSATASICCLLASRCWASGSTVIRE